EAYPSQFSAGGLDVRRMNLETEVCKFDLVFNFAEAGSNIELEIDYGTDLFAPATIERLFRHLKQLFQSIIVEPSRPIETVNLIPPEDRRLLGSFENGENKPLSEDTLVTLFERTVSAFPDHTAVISRDGTWTYAEVDRMAQRIAGALQGQFNVRRGEPIGVF